MEEILKTEVKILNNALLNYLISGPKSIQEFKVDCSRLDERFFRDQYNSLKKHNMILFYFF